MLVLAGAEWSARGHRFDRLPNAVDEGSVEEGAD
jgi:hypothetical protein